VSVVSPYLICRNLLIVIAICSQVTTKGLLSFDGLKQGLEISCSETLVVSALDYFQKECWPVFNGFRENLQQVALFVVVNQDFEFLKHIDFFFNFKAYFGESRTKVVIICVRNLVKELNTSGLHCFDRRDNIVGAHCDVLHTGTSVVVNVLLNLALANAISGLIDGHFDLLIEVSNNNGAQ